MINNMEKDSMFIKIVINMMVNGSIISMKYKDHLLGLMVINIMVNGKAIKKIGKQ